MKKRRAVQTLLLVITVVLVLGLLAGARSADWRTASREPVGLAPDPAATPEAVVQVYGARTVGARGVFGVHTWVAVKPPRAAGYVVYEVTGWKLRWSESAVSVRAREPDARWFGAEPELYAELRGKQAEALLGRIDAAAKSYPFAGEYRAWPGPNSNTFTAWITRQVPELRADLPPTAIGKDYLRGKVLASAPSGRGLQFSLAGLLALTASSVEGLELNVLGLSFGVDPWPPALKLPLAGRLGASSAP
ncbi:MAG TPA: DUF3750 domain-containing protein [Burkholderiales bacterium]|nr:DUF3750 domain-containing protein [Burkholderiales bacterium]